MFTEMGEAAVESHMIACVNESLSLYLMSNARFMCERLVAEFPSEVSLSSQTSIHDSSKIRYRPCMLMRMCIPGKYIPAGNMLL